MRDDRSISGSVLRIERSSIHDGPGLRTVVFLKGCPLHCAWCSTPESQHPGPQKGYNTDLCTACGVCVRSCPEGALSLSENGSKVVTDEKLCSLCFSCVSKCPRNAWKQYGSSMTVKETVREIAKDEIFFFHSGGGVTISGGESLLQADFVAETLRECKERGIHTAIETSFHVPYDRIERVLPWLDVLYVDIKHMDPDAHRQWIGPDNSLILENIKKADQSGHRFDIVVRIPLIPGVNDSDANLQAIASFSKSLHKLREIEILPYHRLGTQTYRNLSLDYTLKETATPTQERIVERAGFLAAQNPGVSVRVGGGLAG